MLAFDFSPLGSIAGSLVSSALSSREAKKNREWQEAFYQHRHQWEVADLKAAGLNPILSAMNSASAVPSGAMASTPDLGASLSQGMTTAQQKRYQDSLIKMQQAESQSRIELNKSNEQKNIAEAAQASANVGLISKNTLKADREMDFLMAQTTLAGATTAKEKKYVESLVKDMEFRSAQIDTEREKQKVFTQQIYELKTQMAKNLADARRSGAESALADARRRNEAINAKVLKAEENLKYSQSRLNESMSDYNDVRETVLQLGIAKHENESEFYNSKLGRLFHKGQLALGATGSAAKDLATMTLLFK